MQKLKKKGEPPKLKFWIYLDLSWHPFVNKKHVVFSHLTKWSSLIGHNILTGSDVTDTMCISTNEQP